MSLSEVVDEEYRLRVGDLNGEPLRARIVNVSFQGIEEMSPVLHIAGQTRRLHLTQAQSRSMIRITASATPSSWVGHTVELYPKFLGGVWFIEIRPPARPRFLARRLPELSDRMVGWLVATTAVILSLLLATWYASTHYARIVETLRQLLP